jgi:diacyltrehalose acyltransferase
MVTAAAAAGLTGTLVLGHALDNTAERLDPALAATVFGIGGRGDATSGNVPNKLEGEIGPGFSDTGSFTYQPISYPADFNFQTSTDAGALALYPQVKTLALTPGTTPGSIQVTAYSEGTLVAEQVKRELAAAGYPGGSDKVTFLFIASPYVPNGGLFARLPGFTIPGVLPVFSAAQPTDYNSTYVTNEYDPYADFPAYFNPLSLANSLLAVEYAHPDQYYDNIDPTDPNTPKFTTTATNSAGGTDTYILVYNPQLPLFGPIRQLESVVPQLTPLVEPLVSAVEPLARVIIDMGYTDRTNANPQTPTAFSFFTPPERVFETIAEVPGAIGQGVENLLAGHDVTPPPASQTHTVPAPADQSSSLAELQALKPLQASKGQLTLVPAPSTPAAEQAKPKANGDDLDKLVNRITQPKVKSDGGKVSPTTKAPASGFGHGAGSNLLKDVFGGAKSTAPAADSAAAASGAPKAADAPKTHRKRDGHRPSHSAGAA